MSDSVGELLYDFKAEDDKQQKQQERYRHHRQRLHLLNLYSHTARTDQHYRIQPNKSTAFRFILAQVLSIGVGTKWSKIAPK